MDAIDQTLQATERLLKALQEDRSTIGDSPFVDRLTDLRSKHRETTEYLSRLWEEESRYHSVSHTTCRQWAVHHCPSERVADPCPNEYPAPSRAPEFVIHHRPSEYTIHHRPSEYTIHHRPRGYAEEQHPRQPMREPHQTDYPGPPQPSEFSVYRPSGELVDDFRRREFAVDQRLKRTSAQHIRSDYSVDPLPAEYPIDHPLVDYSVQYDKSAFPPDQRAQKALQDLSPSQYYLHHRSSEYSLGNLPPEYLRFRAPLDVLAQQGSEEAPYEISATETPLDQLPSTSAFIAHPTASSADRPPRKHSTSKPPPEYFRDQLSEDSLWSNSPKEKGRDEAPVASELQSTSKTRPRPKASSAHPRMSVPTIHPRHRERVGSLPARPIVQNAADMLHLAAKATAKRREERARAREKESNLEKVDEKREEPTQTLDRNEVHIKEETDYGDDRAPRHTQDGSAGKEGKNIEENDHKPIRKKDKGGGRIREKSSRRNDREESQEKTREDSSKRVEFMEDKPGEGESATMEDDRGKTCDGANEEDRLNGFEPSPAKARPPRPKSAKGIRESKKPIPRPSSTKREVVPEPIQNFVPQITVPVPFKFATRKPIVNKYSTKFVEEMVMKKKHEEEEEEAQASKPKPFTAHAVPKSTYVSTNPRVSDKAYVEAIRRRVTATMRRHFEQEALYRRSKSLGDLSVRPVPITTYVAPAIPEYRRSRSTHRRAVQLLVEATTPPYLREHTIRTHVSAKVRHHQCLEDQTGERYPRPPIPDFQRLHAEMENALKCAPHKATTVPRPFHLTDPKAYHHRQCKSSSPPRWRAQSIRRMSRGDVAIRPTHSSTIRKEAIRQRQEMLSVERHRSEKFWEDRRDEMDLSRMKLMSSMGSLPNVSEEIEKKTAEKIKHAAESTRDYEKFLIEMQQRVIERPLIMEQQSIIAQKQKFTRKYEERLAAVGKGSSKSRANASERRDSDVSGATYSVKSKEQADVGGNDYGSGDFESEEETSEGKKQSPKSVSSSTSSSSGTASSKSSSSKKSHSSATSASSSSRNETKI